MLSKEELEKEFTYDPVQGTLSRKTLRRNAKRSVVHRESDEYPRVYFKGKNLLVHRVVYIMHYGFIPEGLQIDHINRDKSDYRIKNLRAVPQEVNMENTGVMKNNTSGFKGVVFHKPSGKWFGRKMQHGKRKNTSYYLTPEEANEALQHL